MVESTAAQVICDILKAEEVRFVFSNPGSTMIPVLDALTGCSDIRNVVCLHEGIAMAMADGYAMGSGKPGVVCVHAAPGTMNLMGNLFNASTTGTPVVILAGQPDSRILIEEPMLAADLVRATDQFTKWSWQVARADELPKALRRAFKVAMEPPTGPVFLAVPRDILDQPTDAQVLAPSSYHVSNRTVGDPAEIKKAAKFLVEAENPAILAGFGVAMSDALPELIELTELVAARVYAQPSCFPANHPLFCGSWRSDMGHVDDATRGTDVLLAVGCKVFKRYNYSPNPLVPEGIKCIHIDNNPWEVAKNYPVAVGIVGDPKLALQEVIKEVREALDETGLAGIKERFGRVRERSQQLKRTIREEAQIDWNAMPIKAGRLINEVQDIFGDNLVIVDEAVCTSTYLGRYLRLEAPKTYFASEGSCLGWGLPAALGVKLAFPDRQVLCFVGVGSAMYSIQSLWTAAKWGISLIVILCNNRAYMNVKSALYTYDGYVARTKDYTSVNLGGVDFLDLAKGLGVSGQRVEAPEELGPALLAASKAAKPFLVEVLLDPKDRGYPRAPLA